MAPTKSNSKHASASAVKPKKRLLAASVVGAPAQHNQSSRKGKKAWRKNVDIEDLEEKLDGLREEERTFGCVFSLNFFSVQSSNVICRLPLQKKTDRELFIVDIKGDDKGMQLLTFSPHPQIISHNFGVSLSSKIPTTLLPHHPQVTPNHLSALCRACGPCTAPKIPREFARERAAAQNCAKGSQGTAEQHRGLLTAWRGQRAS
jgi:hypothetical protein